MQLVQMKIKIILKHLIQCEGVPTFWYYDYTVIMITITSVTVAFWWKLQLVVLVVILWNIFAILNSIWISFQM